MFLIKLGKQTSKMAIKRNEIMKDLKLSEKCGGILILIICLIRASAADVQAGSSPIGYVDNIDYNGTVYGWAKDPDAPNAAITVEVWADNTILCGTAVASWYHDSVAGSHGFTFTLPENIRSSTPPLPPAGLHSIYVYGLDSVGGDPKALIQNGNPFPTPLNVSSNDNSWLHTTGGSYQIGPSSSNLVGGRPNNKLSAVAAKSLLSAAWQGMGLPWFKEGYGKITVTAAPRVGGAISSIMWDNVEFLDSGGHGAALQYIEHDSTTSELYNPTEAGSAADDAFAWYSQSIINLNPLNSTQNPPDPISYSHIYQHGSSSALQTLTKTSS